MVSKELQEKIKKYGISTVSSKEESISVYEATDYKISEFKDILDKFLLESGAKEGQVSFVAEHDYGCCGDDSCSVNSSIIISALIDKTEEQLIKEVAEAELKEHRKLEAANRRKLLKREKDKLAKDKKEQEERVLYESLKKKFESK